MKKRKISLLAMAGAAAGVFLGAGVSLAAHPDIPLYTYEEVAQQFGMPMVPVQLDPKSMKGMPYSPKQTCGNCHNGTTLRWDGQGSVDPADADRTLVSYTEMTDQAFHSELGAQEWAHDTDTDTTVATTQTGKPWSSSNGMWGKW